MVDKLHRGVKTTNEATTLSSHGKAEGRGPMVQCGERPRLRDVPTAAIRRTQTIAAALTLVFTEGNLRLPRDLEAPGPFADALCRSPSSPQRHQRGTLPC